MTPEALKALQASIAHWEQVVRDPKNTKVGEDSCALCARYSNLNCSGCPVHAKTGRLGCGGTPFGNFVCALRTGVTTSNLRTFAQDELDFLKSLLPALPKAEEDLKTQAEAIREIKTLSNIRGLFPNTSDSEFYTLSLASIALTLSSRIKAQEELGAANHYAYSSGLHQAYSQALATLRTLGLAKPTQAVEHHND